MRVSSKNLGFPSKVTIEKNKIQDEINLITASITRLEKDADHFKTKADELAASAEEKGSMRLLSESNALRKGSVEKSTEAEKQRKRLEELKAKIKK